MVLDLLRSLLIDWALDQRDEEMFHNLLSPDWAQYVVMPGGDGEPASTQKWLVLWDKRTGRLATLWFPNIPERVVISVAEEDWDDRGWRDQYGLTLYDRLRSAGYKMHAMWIPTDTREFQGLSEVHRVIHPRQLVLEHPDRTLRVIQESK